MPYYDNEAMLICHIATWQSYPKHIRDIMRFIIVDDGSPNKPAKEAIGKTDLNLKLFRVDLDIPWNQHGARNLGMKHVDTNWAFMTDMDAVLTTDNLQKLLELDKDPNKTYTVERLKMPDKETYKYHPNTFLMTKETFWKVNGYDTNYCGTYGGDGIFKRDIEKVSTIKHLDNVFIHYYPRGYFRDSGTNTLERTGFFKDQYRKLLNSRDLRKGWDPVPFPWHEVEL